ncbi:hypothetical protein [Streptomyces montanus]|uniref:hypothetical protein n=1 Tax=Streptomyces montanus TaxID=2580423 RepID=UPI00319E24E9
MVSSSHEAMHRIFQEDPGAFARTFRALDLPFPDPVAVSLMPTDLTEQPSRHSPPSLMARTTTPLPS